MPAVMPTTEPFHELSFYTLAHSDWERFLHQHAVDAYTAQTAGADSKPIGLLYALVGLYLTVERDYTGREVQRAHLQLARDKTDFPPLSLPADRGAITVSEVLDSPAGEARDAAILRWCAAVWAAYGSCHATVSAYCQQRRV